MPIQAPFRRLVKHRLATSGLGPCLVHRFETCVIIYGSREVGSREHRRSMRKWKHKEAISALCLRLQAEGV